MHVNVLYIQPDASFGDLVKNSIADDDINFIFEKSVEDGVKACKKNSIDIVVFASGVFDGGADISVALDDFTKDYKKMSVIVEFEDEEIINVVAASEKSYVKKIFLAPTDGKSIAKGIEDTAILYKKQAQILENKAEYDNEVALLKETVSKLKRTIDRQKNSYAVIGKFFQGALESYVSNSKSYELTKNIVRAACKKMLVLQTTANINCGNIKDAIRVNIEEVQKVYPNVVLSNIDSNLTKDADNNIMADMTFAVWFLALFKAMTGFNGVCSVSINQVLNAECEIFVQFDGSFGESCPETDAYIDEICSLITKEVSVNKKSDGEVYCIKFDI